MIRVVIGYQQSFAKNRLAVTPWYAGEQIGLRIFYQILHRLQVLPEFLDACIPSSGTGGSFRRGPISFRPFWRSMLRVAAELQNIPLRDAQVLQQHPKRMGKTSRLLSDQVRRNSSNNFVELGVRTAALE